MTFDWSNYRGNLDWLEANTILMVRHGSHAYGLNVATSDEDFKGVTVPPSRYRNGFVDRFEQAESKDPDFVVYDVIKFMKLAADANPSILEVLFIDDDNLLFCSPAGQQLRDARDQFLSRKVRHTYAGYAHQQLKRIRLHRSWHQLEEKPPYTRAEMGLPERTLIPKDQLAAAQSMIREKLNSWIVDNLDEVDDAAKIAVHTKMTDVLTEMHLTADETAAARALGFTDNFIHLLDLERRYKSGQQHYQDYLNWKATRNPKRAELEAKFGYDCYAADTEFLTDRGWLSFNDVAAVDKLATVFVSPTGENLTQRRHLGIEYQEYTDKFDGTFNGDMQQFYGNHVDALVTPNHRMLIRKRERRSGKLNAWDLEEAAHVPDTFEVVLATNPRTKSYSNKETFAGLPISDTTYLSLMGWYLSDGCMAFNSSGPDDIRISQKKGGRLHGPMAHFCNTYTDGWCSLYAYEREPTAFRPYVITEMVLSVRHPAITRRLFDDCASKAQKFGSNGVKRIPRYVFGLSKRLMEKLLDAMMLGDGTVRNTSLESLVYYTNSKDLADDVMELAVMCGWETSVYGPYKYSKDDDDYKGMYHVHVNKNVERTRVMVRNQNVKRIPVQNQRIVCFSVPNGTLVTRRNGHVAYHGNCKHGMHLARLLLTAEEVLETGRLLVRRPDRELLLSIRNGGWSYERLVEFAEKLEADLPDIAARSPLPNSPDRARLSQLCERIVESMP